MRASQCGWNSKTSVSNRSSNNPALRHSFHSHPSSSEEPSVLIWKCISHNCCTSLANSFNRLMTLGRMTAVAAFLFCCPLTKDSMAQEAAKKQTVEFKSAPSWVWLGEPNDAQQIVLRREFTLEGKVEQSFVAATADNQCGMPSHEMGKIRVRSIATPPAGLRRSNGMVFACN